MVKQIPNFIANKILSAAQLIQLWNSICEDETLGYDGSSRLPKSEFNIGNLTAIINGSLVKDILMRTGGKLQNYSGAGALLGEITIDNLLLSATNFNTNYLEGFDFVSNSTNPTYQIDVAIGKCLAKDKLTIIELDTPTTADLTNHISPSSDTTYHLYTYPHSGTGVTLLDFSTSLTPTTGSGDANLPNLDGTKYRRIASFKTDGSGDLRSLIGRVSNDGTLKIKFDTTFITDDSQPTTATLTTLDIPSGLIFKILGTVKISHEGSSASTHYIWSGYKSSTTDQEFYISMDDEKAEEQTVNINLLETNTSGQVWRLENPGGGSADESEIRLSGYIDNRNNN